MSIRLSSVSTYSLAFIKEQIVPSFTPQQKKIIVIAALALGFLAAAWMFMTHWCRNGEVKGQKQLENLAAPELEHQLEPLKIGEIPASPPMNKIAAVQSDIRAEVNDTGIVEQKKEESVAIPETERQIAPPVPPEEKREKVDKGVSPIQTKSAPSVDTPVENKEAKSDAEDSVRAEASGDDSLHKKEEAPATPQVVFLEALKIELPVSPRAASPPAGMVEEESKEIQLRVSGEHVTEREPFEKTEDRPLEGGFPIPEGETEGEVAIADPLPVQKELDDSPEPKELHESPDPESQTEVLSDQGTGPSEQIGCRDQNIINSPVEEKFEVPEEAGQLALADLPLFNEPKPVLETKTYPDGTVATGEFKEGKLHGQGKKVFPNVIWEGQFQKGKLNGPGKQTYKDGTIFEGEFRDGVLYGKGKIIRPGKEIEEGEFKNNMLHGMGKRTFFANGEVWEGKFEENALLEGKITRGKAVLEGSFKNGKLHGQGKITHADGTVVAGNFREGQLRGKF